MMNAIALLEKDHRKIERLFERLSRRKASPAERRRLLRLVIQELSVHAAAEEQWLYPLVRRAVSGGDALADHALGEHQEAKELLARLDGAAPDATGARRALDRLIRAVRSHVEEEETKLFPVLRVSVGRKDLDDLGTALAGAKRIAPTHPHPAAPTRPPANVVAGVAAAAVDRARDALEPLAEAGRRLVTGKSTTRARLRAAKRPSPSKKPSSSRARKLAAAAGRRKKETPGRSAARSAAGASTKKASRPRSRAAVRRKR